MSNYETIDTSTKIYIYGEKKKICLGTKEMKSRAREIGNTRPRARKRRNSVIFIARQTFPRRSHMCKQNYNGHISHTYVGRNRGIRKQ